jgi:hypothetical protein
MNVPVVKKLASECSRTQIDEAVLAFEKNRSNLLSVEGNDDGEKMSNLLAAQFVRHRMDNGMELNLALREYGQRVKGIMGGGGAFGPPKKP